MNLHFFFIKSGGSADYLGNRPQNACFVSLADLALDDHLVDYKMRLLDVKHDLLFSLSLHPAHTTLNSELTTFSKYLSSVSTRV